MFEDRLYSFISDKGVSILPKGKKAVVVVTCGGPAKVGKAVCDRIAKNLEMLGIEIVGDIVYSDAGGTKRAEDDADVLSKAKEFGKTFRTNYREYDPHYQSHES